MLSEIVKLVNKSSELLSSQRIPPVNQDTSTESESEKMTFSSLDYEYFLTEIVQFFIW